MFFLFEVLFLLVPGTFFEKFRFVDRHYKSHMNEHTNSNLIGMLFFMDTSTFIKK